VTPAEREQLGQVRDFLATGSHEFRSAVLTMAADAIANRVRAAQREALVLTYWHDAMKRVRLLAADLGRIS